MIKDTSLQRMEARDSVVSEMKKLPFFSDKRIERVANCSSIEIKQRWKDGRIRTLYANHCHDRICPLCQKRYHQHAAAWLRDVDKAERKKAEELIGKSITDKAWYARYKFMTISPFVSSHDLSDMKEKLRWLCSEVSTRLNNYYFVKRVGVKPLGYFRSFEITYDKDKGFHPHIHCIYLYPERAPYVDQVEVERAVFKALLKTPFLGTLENGEPQTTVSLKITDCYKEDVHAAEFELTKYITKLEAFDDLEKYCRLSMHWHGIPQFRASGCFAGMKNKERYSSIVQNLHFASTNSQENFDFEVVAFYGKGKSRLAYQLRPDLGVQAAMFLRRQDLRKYNKRFTLSAEDEQRRFYGYPYAFWFDSGGLHVKELPPWTEYDENEYIRACRLNIFYKSDLGTSKKFRVSPKLISDKIGFEQVCLMELLG